MVGSDCEGVQVRSIIILDQGRHCERSEAIHLLAKMTAWIVFAALETETVRRTANFPSHWQRHARSGP